MIYGCLDRRKAKAKWVTRFLTSTGEKTIPLKYALWGTQKINYKPNKSNLIPDDASVVIFCGMLRGGALVMQEVLRRNIPYIYMDNCLFASSKGSKNKFWRRCAVNGFTPKYNPNTKAFRKYKGKMQEWRGGKGKYILVTPPSDVVIRANDNITSEQWTTNIVNEIKKHTDREIKIRVKPSEDVRFASGFKQTLNDVLDNTYCLVTHSSSLAIDATIKGIPVHTPSNMFNWGIDLNTLETDDINNEKDRKEFLDFIESHNFEVKEIENGKAWKELRNEL